MTAEEKSLEHPHPLRAVVKDLLSVVTTSVLDADVLNF